MSDDMEWKERLGERIEEAASVIARSRRIVVTTGAGISRESGLPTFRDPEGLWNKYRPDELATREAFLSNPKLVWGWYRERLRQAREVQPNPGHYALAALEQLLPRFLLITQNIDNLHRRAGSREIIELHGCIERYRCFDYAHPAEESPDWGDEPPLCHCGSLIRPDVVWFGEPLPEAELECAFGETQRCDALLAIGTSGLVHPAAQLPGLAKHVGAKVIEVNIHSSAITDTSDLFLEGESGRILPEIVSLVGNSLSGRQAGRPDR
jgi:NAD-dependent deacetylase